MLADTAYDAGYVVGTIIGAAALGWLVIFAWGAARGVPGFRVRSGLDHANHWRSLSAAGFLWLVSMVGRLSS